MTQASLDVRYYDTPTPARMLKAGPLSAEFEGGDLRHIRYGGLEILRAISFVVRDRDWGSYAAQIDDLQVREQADRVELSYSARPTPCASCARRRA